MNYVEELNLLDVLGKGKTARIARFRLTKAQSKKYSHYQKNALKHQSDPTTVKDMLQTASRKTQAIFKISSFGHTPKRIIAHMRYISRCSKLALEDQDGNKLISSKSQHEILKDWSLDFKDSDRNRHTMHLVLSTPPGTDREATLHSAKAFLEKEYKSTGHDYVFVAHHDTDHPHVHAVIKMVSHFGQRLNPRKAYLREVRKTYAQICRHHGITVEASSRAERGLSGPSQRSAFVQMKRSQRRPKADLSLIAKIQQERTLKKIMPHPSEEKMVKRNQIIRKRYAEKSVLLTEKAKTLPEKSDRQKYQQAAKLLDQFAQTLPVEATRGEKLHRQLDEKMGISTNRDYLIEKGTPADQALDQYYAVTLGIKNAKGIYVSPAELFKDKIKATVSENLMAQKENQKDTGLELEMDMNES